MNRSVFLRTAAVAALLGVSLAGCTMMQRSDVETYEASLSGAQEVPPVTTSGTGSAQARYNRGTSTLSWTVNYSGLSGPATAAHIHGPAGPGANAGVVIPFPNAGTSPFSGETKITPEQYGQLSSGQWYVNVHTARAPGGEVRGQLRRR
jgi:hypothetical protein